MDKVVISKIADYIGGIFMGEDGFITAVTTDSRNSFENAMFVGLKGERVDGNDFALDFLKKGGKCAVVEKDISVPAGKSIIKVENTKKALGKIAEYYRQCIDVDVVGVTGSVGKTSTKDMLHCVLSHGFKSNATKGNFNNEIGVPLTIFDLDSSYDKAVVEMGMNNLGEIARLTNIAKPKVAVITNIGTAHIGNLGSKENILRAKMEISESMSDDDLLILNGDDPMLWGNRYNVKIPALYYGIQNKECDFVAYDIKVDKDGSTFKVDIGGFPYDFKLNVEGNHHVYNALAAIACGIRYDMNIEKIQEGIFDFTPSGMRQKKFTVSGITFIEDCYNASTDSMKSALETLDTMEGESRKIAVLADILEQGEFAEENHKTVGEYVAQTGVNALITVGTDSLYIAKTALEKGVTDVHSFKENMVATEFLKTFVQKGDIILFKGSRGMKLEEVSTALQEHLKGLN